jgi:hypothetical protein
LIFLKTFKVFPPTRSLSNALFIMEGIISPLIDSLKASLDLLVLAGHALPDDAGVDRALERFRRVIASGEKAAEGLGIEPQ